MPGDIITLKNDELCARISRDGAQLVSLDDRRTGEHFLWNGDPSVWRESAPWLFPVIGKLREDRFIYGGQSYAPPMHGFAKRMKFEPSMIGAESCVLTLTETENTLAVYPWRFRLDITFSLAGRRLTATAAVTDTDDKKMFFSLGAHPGFFCQKGDQLDFGRVNGLRYRRLEPGTHLLTTDRYNLPLEGGRMTLDGSLFEDDAMILDHPEINQIILRKAEGTDIRFTFDTVPYFGLWTRHLPGNEVRYICLEPWFGVDDPVDADGLIEHKEGIRVLGKNETQSLTISAEAL